MDFARGLEFRAQSARGHGGIHSDLKPGASASPLHSPHGLDAFDESDTLDCAALFHRWRGGFATKVALGTLGIRALPTHWASDSFLL
jgi:hypothetical protein